MSNIAAIVLAAGRSIRFGSESKLLAQFRRKALVRHAVEAAIGSGVEPVIVVTGHRAADVGAVLKGLPATMVHNTAYSEGLSTSLKAGFAALPPMSEAAVIVLGDMPFVTADLIDRLVHGWRTMRKPEALVPTINGQRGNPVVLSRKLQDVINELSGDVGAGPLLRGRPGVVEWPIEDPAILQDVDTQDEMIRFEPDRSSNLP